MASNNTYITVSWYCIRDLSRRGSMMLYLLTFLLSQVFFFSACEEKIVNPIDIDDVVFTGDASEITTTTAQLTAYVNLSSEIKDVQMGFFLSTDESPSRNNGEVILSSKLEGNLFYVLTTNLSPETKYYYKAFVIIDDDYYYGAINSFSTLRIVEETIGGVKAVDLGLSVKWSSLNVGAKEPEACGDYFAWGEIAPYYEPGYGQSSNPVWKDGKDYGYDMPSYTWIDGKILKYNTNHEFGLVDGVLSFAGYGYVDDAAFLNMDGGWRTPTIEEWIELKDNCSWTWKINYNGSGVNGYLISGNKTGYTNQAIFLPASGCWDSRGFFENDITGNYWSSSLYTDTPHCAWLVTFDSGMISPAYCGRNWGLSIRPVYEGDISITGVQLDKASLSLVVGCSANLMATIIPEDAPNKAVAWSSDNTSVANVDNNGQVIARHAGIATITASSVDGYNAHCLLTVVDPIAVDLGLSVMWAPFNIGATTPENRGDFFAWGETNPKNNYSWSTYKWGNGDVSRVSKYQYSWNYVSSEINDNIIILEPEDDAATINWGKSWRIPTALEWEELLNKDNCSWAWINDYKGTGVNGLLVTSKKPGYLGNTIFLPASGSRNNLSQNYYFNNQGNYWSSSLCTKDTYFISGDSFALSTLFTSDYAPCPRTVFRNAGFSIRPVYCEFIPISSISLSDDTIDLSFRQSLSLEATLSPMNATDKTIRWQSDDDSIIVVQQDGTIIPVSEGSARITALASNGLSASCIVSSHYTMDAIGEVVDLGLSVKWASFNVGARNEEEYGDFFAWGEVTPKRSYDLLSYRWFNDSSLSKYNSMSANGVVDNNLILDAEDDAATMNWGAEWRMPTKEEWEELHKCCLWDWMENYHNSGVNGYLIKSNVEGYSNNSIFLPAGGGDCYMYQGYYSITDEGRVGRYWTSSLNDKDSFEAIHYSFNSDGAGLGSSSRVIGRNIRPVCP